MPVEETAASLARHCARLPIVVRHRDATRRNGATTRRDAAATRRDAAAAGPAAAVAALIRQTLRLG